MKGYPFTWERGRGSDSWIEERLDRMVATSAWRQLFGQAIVFNILLRQSDHSAIFLSIHKPHKVARSYRFRFENAWLRDAGCKEVISAAWRETMGMDLPQKLERCGSKLMTWGGEHFHRFGKKIKSLKAEVNKFRDKRDTEGLRKFREADAKLHLLLEQEDVYWRQRAKQHWLRSADANTRFFHQYASHRRKKNLVEKLKGMDGTWCTGEDLAREIHGYYNNIFCSEGSGNSNFFTTIPQKISNALNLTLLSPFTEQETIASCSFGLLRRRLVKYFGAFRSMKGSRGRL
ncbi:unnamed protein product [Cuscuta campestris]|uniref:Reverse transcriptase n=1 Tax=Cuscuta campestris TaxID=132261 RepID=A0A484NDY2_9ASTE|nr:unnamed protein product [Cuscuta campestris]